MADDLAAWLTQIWDEDEVEVRKWQATLLADVPVPAALLGGIVVPRTALARIAADRQILAAFQAADLQAREAMSNPHDVAPFDAGCYLAGRNQLEWVLKVHATEHADRPGYQEEWQPE